MRNHSSLLAFLVLALGAVAPAYAELKIVTIRAAEIVAASPQFKSSQAQMKTEFERRKTELETEARKFAEDSQKFRREADLMSSDARAKAEKELQTRRIDLDYKQRQFGEDFQKRDRELSESLMNSIKQVVVDVATSQGADLVVQDPVYAAPGIDVTDEVIKRLQAGDGKAK